jgi:hypothetical protein
VAVDAEIIESLVLLIFVKKKPGEEPGFRAQH